MTPLLRVGSLLLAVSLVSAGGAVAQDRDGDGLADAFEQALLEKFVPTLVLSAGECAGRPAAFEQWAPDPRVVAQDGTLYGHVSRRTITETGTEIEIKYFHLWARDCGRPSHGLDVEHVSALVRAPRADAPVDEWQAAYWYAAAHEGTVCDASSGAMAAAVRATQSGPYVYVSRGKHASYLNRSHCKWGCGSDLCDPGEPTPRTQVVNLGERDAPLNGTIWLASERWDLGDKLATDFDPELRMRFDRDQPESVVALRVARRPFQAPILGGDTGLDALIEAGEAATLSLGAAAEATATAVEATGRAVGTATARTLRGVAWFLRVKK
jgi:hypothetical protein